MRPGCFIALLILAAPAAADFPVASFRHAEIQALEEPASLPEAFRDLARGIEGPAWVGYAVPRVAAGPAIVVEHEGRSGGCGTYYLEGGRGDEVHTRDGEAAETLLVLLRVVRGEVQKVRALSADCKIDAGGLPVYGFAAVDPRQSLDLLVVVAGEARRRSGGRRSGDQAVMAIALHDEPAADGILERVATGGLAWGLEEQAVFWLGAARGRRGFEILQHLLESTDDAKLRQHVAFGLHVSRVPESVEALVDLARHDADRRVRSQALFWLAQEAGQRAVAELERAAEADPDLEVKKHAIFALSQLPPEKGVPLLIRYARTHAHPEVRQQAMFWLGQSDDERALELFEEILLD